MKTRVLLLPKQGVGGKLHYVFKKLHYVFPKTSLCFFQNFLMFFERDLTGFLDLPGLLANYELIFIVVAGHNPANELDPIQRMLEMLAGVEARQDAGDLRCAYFLGSICAF